MQRGGREEGWGSVLYGVEWLGFLGRTPLRRRCSRQRKGVKRVSGVQIQVYVFLSQVTHGGGNQQLIRDDGSVKPHLGVGVIAAPEAAS